MTRRAFLGVSAIVFAASAATTIVSAASMSAMGEMPLPGGWTMSHMWMLMPGQTWLGATTSFVGMWVVMMVAMMLPSLTPILWRYHEAIGGVARARAGSLTALVGLGYFLAWSVVGVLVFPLGVTMMEVAMRQPAPARAMPIVVGTAILIAGILQRSAWKARHLAFCREAPDRGHEAAASRGDAWRHGLYLGIHCIRACAGLTVVLLALGVMDLRVMAAVAVSITVERLVPNGVPAARVIGGGVVAVGLLELARATPLV